MNKTISALQNDYYWSRMEQDVRLCLNTCKLCLSRKTGHQGKQPEQQKSVVGFPFEKIAIDITGPLPQARNGDKYILGVIDYFTKYPMLISLPNMEASTVAKALLKHWIAIFGVPQVIHSDRGTCFESNLFQEMCSIMNIKKTRTAPYYPKSDGLVERLFRTTKDMIYATTATYNKEWNEILFIVEMGLRSTIQATTRLSPYELVFGYPMKLPVQWTTPHYKTMQYTETNDDRKICSEYVMDLQKKLNNLHAKCINSQRKDKCLNRRNLEADLPYTIGATVMARILPIEKGINQPRFDGPYKVIKLIGQWTYELRHEQTGKEVTRNYHHLKPCSSIGPEKPKQEEERQENGQISRRTLRKRFTTDRLGFLRREEV